MKTFKFTAVRRIDAESEEEALEMFANGSWDFAAEADVEEVCEVCDTSESCLHPACQHH